MRACGACGRENPPDARFCNACGAPLPAVAEAPRAVRKTVTVLFSDVAGSTALGERLDPEATRRVMGRWFEAARAELERHGGTVEKFVGDAVMAVFGVPAVHEDDALRAVRAAAGLRSALGRLNGELERDHGLRLEVRTGVNTGEVVAGEGETLATGDAVNVAARLEQAAPPGEILLGASTFALVRDAVDAVPVEPLALRGKAASVEAHRLLAVRADAPGFARRLDAPLVGRAGELAQLRQAYERAVAGPAAVLFTLLGPAGIGKSRLAEELVAEVAGRATVLRGRCLPYGEGITYRPLVEMLGGVAFEEALAGEPRAPLLIERLSAATARGGEPGPPDETAWAVRKLLERLARERPVLVLLDDLNWAEPTFLDLVDHVAEWSRGAPILVLCLARPELLELRPVWGGGKLNATSLLLEPLSAEESERLVDALLAAGELPAATRGRVTAAAEGNPLFVEQMLALVRETEADDVAVPGTIQALLAARLDRLDRDERAVLERAAVEGKRFHRDAVAALAPEEVRPAVDAHLRALVRKELIRPDEPGASGEETLAFRHQLVRDAAYESMPKELRAELHERFARRLEASAERAGELDEVLGFHLERAHRYRTELGSAGEAERALAARAAGFLRAAGREAAARRDVPAARGLLERAAALLADDDPLRPDLLLELADALVDAGEFARAARHAADVAARADERVRARARLVELDVEAQVSSGRNMADALADAAAAAETLERLGDLEGAAAAKLAVGQIQAWIGQAAAGMEPLRTAIRLAERAGARRIRADAATALLGAAVLGPTRVSEALALFDELEPLLGRATWGHVIRAQLLAAGGRLEEARAAVRDARGLIEELGSRVTLGGSAAQAAEIEVYAGDLEAAERLLRHGAEVLASMGETGFRATVVAMLAEVVARRGRAGAAAALLDDLDAYVTHDDADPQVRARCARARVAALRGDHAAAERWAREAVAAAATTDFLELQAGASLALAEVLRAASRNEEAAAEAGRAEALYERKGVVVMAERVRALLEELRAPA